MRRSIDWHYLGDAFSTIARRTPLIRVIDWYNSRIMKKYLSDVLDARYKDLRTGSCVFPDAVNKSTLDLILADYMSKHKDKAADTLDAGFKAWAIPQLRIMFFVGHDSGTATLCYAFYLLSKNASALEKMRTEHDDIFGTDISAAPHLLRTQPHLLNKLAYTTAVIKEVLRLFTPASGFRFGNAETELHSNGKRYPTENTNVWILHGALHRNPRYWKDASLFIPERFLVGPEDALYPIKGAWRPFEHGPRDCIGQALAMSTLRVSLVMLVRTFDVKPAYDEWDHIHNHRISTKRVCRFDGERAYQVGQSGAHPADGLPCRIIVRERKTVGI
jgi:cytochrome P450